ncbi:MAG: helix-turn-helix domain-containing protein [Clostridia bacterium]|nr:helix-turn-helix domain-containing protein [Clostridia bacterium]
MDLQYKKISSASDKNNEYRLTNEDKTRFTQKEEALLTKLYEYKADLKKRDPHNATYERMAELCCVSVDSLKKIIKGRVQDVTKGFLLRFTYGMGMSVDEANEFFELFEGKLSEDRIEDLAFLRAREDGDSIEEFDEELKEIMRSKINKNRKERKADKR